MRLGAFILAAASLLPAVAAAQQNSRAARTVGGSVLRPASTVAWRNYVAVPDGPCGHPMSVQTDCYVNCRPCGPLRPFCFLHRVGRMLDCLIPCNLCCRSGGGGCGGCGGGGSHGCLLGGRRFGCNVCCGAPACEAPTCGGCGGCGHPCGSAFENCCTPACTTGGHCHGCSSALPGFGEAGMGNPGPGNPFLDDPLPPKPTAQPATEVRRVPVRPARPVAAPARMTTASAPTKSPYKIVRATPPSPSRIAPTTSTAAATTRGATGHSVLRKASGEQYPTEPATLKADQQRATPIVRSQSPEETYGYDVPSNPLR